MSGRRGSRVGRFHGPLRQQLHGEGENDSGVLLGADGVEGLEVAKLKAIIYHKSAQSESESKAKRCKKVHPIKGRRGVFEGAMPACSVARTTPPNGQEM